LGQVLKKIASLPEVRQQKVLRLRRQITAGKYDLTERLDEVLDKVLEDLIT
jgi:anti-sigma28 factor (negative regulator of flagellin synthesis)